jgi:SAM-dependent methyltransferase
MADPEEIYVDGYLTGGSDFGPPDTTDPAFEPFLNHVGHTRLRAIEKMTKRPLGPLLDVGCGTGAVLVAAGERNIEAVGVEPEGEAASIAADRGATVHPTLLEDSGLPEASFRTVTAYHVLEHMPDGVGFLQLLSRWVEPGGYVAIEVPNWRSAERKGRGKRWPGLRPLEHVAHYSPSTLEATLERAGLVDVRVRTMTFQWRNLQQRHALASLGLGRFNRSRIVKPFSTPSPDGARYPKAPMRWTLQGIAKAFDIAKVGQVVLGVGRKP